MTNRKIKLDYLKIENNRLKMENKKLDRICKEIIIINKYHEYLNLLKIKYNELSHIITKLQREKMHIGYNSR